MIINLYGLPVENEPEVQMQSMMMEQALYEIRMYSEGMTSFYSESLAFGAMIKVGLKFLLAFISSFQGILITIVATIIAIFIKRKLRHTLVASYGGGGGGSVSVESSPSQRAKAGVAPEDVVSKMPKGVVKSINEAKHVLASDISEDKEKALEDMFNKILSDMGTSEEDFMNRMADAIFEETGDKNTYRLNILNENPATYYISNSDVFSLASVMTSMNGNELRVMRSEINDSTPYLILDPTRYEVIANEFSRIFDTNNGDATFKGFIFDTIINAADYFMIAVLMMVYAPISYIKEESTRNELTNELMKLVSDMGTSKLENYQKQFTEKIKDIGLDSNTYKAIFKQLASSINTEYKIVDTNKLKELAQVMEESLGTFTSSKSVIKIYKHTDVYSATKAFDNTSGQVVLYSKDIPLDAAAQGKNIAASIFKDSDKFDNRLLTDYRSKCNTLKNTIKSVQRSLDSDNSITDADRTIIGTATEISSNIRIVMQSSVQFLNGCFQLLNDPLCQYIINSTIGVLGFASDEIKKVIK